MSMKAVGYQKSLPIDHEQSLIDITLPKPTAKGRDLLVKIEAVSVNPVDTKVRKRAEPDAGQYKVLGWDAVGEVVSVGGEVENFSVGDLVWYAGDITRPGSNSEFHLVDERIVARKPETLNYAQAAAIPLTAITAWELLFDRLQLDACQDASLLIIGASGGVGSILTQLAVQLTSATVIGTASREVSRSWVKKLGAHHVINHQNALSDELARLKLKSVTHVISLNQTDQHFDEIIKVLAPFGHLALIDDPKEPIDILKMKTKSLSLHWELMFTRSMFQTPDIEQQGELLQKVSALIDEGKIVTTIGEHYGEINAQNLRRAHAFIEQGRAIGKIVLEGFCNE